MGKILIIKGGDFSQNAIEKYKPEPIDLIAEMNKSFRLDVHFDNTSHHYDKENLANKRATFFYALSHNVIKGYSHIRISVNSSYKVARQYWNVLAATDGALPIIVQGGTLISDSTEWSEVINENIPNGSVGLAIVVKGEYKDITNAEEIGLAIDLS